MENSFALSFLSARRYGHDGHTFYLRTRLGFSLERTCSVDLRMHSWNGTVECRFDDLCASGEKQSLFCGWNERIEIKNN